MTDTTKPCAAQGPGLSEALEAIIKESATIIGNVPFNNAIAAAKAALAHPVAVEQSQKSAPKPLASNISPGARDGELDPATIEACAKIADKLYEDPAWSPHYQNASAAIACKIRRLAKKTRLAAAPQQGEPVWRKTLEEFAEVWGNSLMGLQTGDDVAEWIHNTLIPEMEDVASPAPDVAVGSVEWSKRYNAETDRLVAVDGDVRWAVNVLLEKIATKFEANETMDIWRSDAASTVRSFKHDLAALTSRVSAPVAVEPTDEQLREWVLETVAAWDTGLNAEQEICAPPRTALDPATVEACARELEQRYPDHKWVNAYCAAIRALVGSVTSTERSEK